MSLGVVVLGGNWVRGSQPTVVVVPRVVVVPGVVVLELFPVDGR